MVVCESEAEAGEGTSQTRQSSLCGVFLAEGMAGAETLRWGKSGFSHELRGDPCSWREVSSLREDFG